MAGESDGPERSTGRGGYSLVECLHCAVRYSRRGYVNCPNCGSKYAKEDYPKVYTKDVDGKKKILYFCDQCGYDDWKPYCQLCKTYYTMSPVRVQPDPQDDLTERDTKALAEVDSYSMAAVLNPENEEMIDWVRDQNPNPYKTRGKGNLVAAQEDLRRRLADKNNGVEKAIEVP